MVRSWPLTHTATDPAAGGTAIAAAAAAAAAAAGSSSIAVSCALLSLASL